MSHFKKAMGLLLAAVMLFGGLGFAGLSEKNWGDIWPQLKGRSYQSRILSLQEDFPPGQAGQRAEEIAAEASQSVVSVYGYSKGYDRQEGRGQGNGNFFESLRQLVPSLGEAMGITKRVSAGTGFFVDNDGHIMTNKHVVADESAEYFVSLAGGRQKPALVKYRDPDNDIAVLKISGSEHQPLDLGDSAGLDLGEPVVGIGNAYGQFENTVSPGSVVALSRTIIASDENNSQKLDNVIQTDAQFYPGYSGGPLLDLEGRVVGINVAIATDWSNVSFSIPINEAKSALSASGAAD